MPNKRVKITVHTPESHTIQILEAINQAGAGIIGNYDYCAFIIKGTGTFRPLPGSNPSIGEKEELNFVAEDKVEFVCDLDKVEQVIRKIKEVHPYEEVAYQVVALLDF